MKKCIRLLIALLLLYFGYQSSFAQSFVRLFDATEQDHSNYDQRLQDSTNALLDIFINDSFADSFAIYDFGFYLHNEVFQGGFPGVFEQVTAQVEAQTEYFVLIGRAYDDEGNFELFIKSKFPGHADFVCLQDVDRISLDGILRSAIEEELGSEIGVGPLNEAMAIGIHFLADRLNYLLYCSCSGSPNQRSINQCPTEHGFAEINVLLRGLGWRRTEISHVRPSTWDDSNEIYDFANKEFRIDGETVTIPDQIVESKATFDSLMSGKVYILDNESFNNGEWETFLAESINPANDYVEGWVIANDGDQYYLYSAYFIGIDNLPAAAAQIRANFNGRSVVLPAMKYVLQVLGNAALDALMQGVIYYIFFEEIDTWEKAFDEVSYLGAVWEGISSLLPWKKAKRLGPIMRAATTALVGVIDKANRDDNYTINQGFADFAVGFGSSYLVELATHPKVTELVSSKLSEVYDRFAEGLVRWYDDTPHQVVQDMVKPVIRETSTLRYVSRFGCFASTTSVLMANNTFAQSHNEMTSLQSAVLSIEKVEVDDMVIAYRHGMGDLPSSLSGDSSHALGWQSYDYLEITPETWQIGSFLLEEEDGSFAEIEANRPITWFTNNRLTRQGDRVWLDISEMGVRGFAELQSIRPCRINTNSLDMSSDRLIERPVITTYRRTARLLGEYTFSNGSRIRCTPNHPLYSLERRRYVPIGDLAASEPVLTARGTEARFCSEKLDESIEEVFNLEVWRAHNYFVSRPETEDFLLAHNSCWDVIKDIFKLLDISFVDAIKIDGRKWSYKVTQHDVPLAKEVDLSEIIGEFKQARIALAKEGTAGMDAVSEFGDIMSYKAMDGTSAQQNIDNLASNIEEAIFKYRTKVNHNGMKGEIWVRGLHATYNQVKPKFLAAKGPNFRYDANKDFISKIFYVDGNGVVYQFDW